MSGTTQLKLDELPPEVLSAIFDLVINDSERLDTRTRTSVTANPTLLVLQLVSRYWRRLTLSTPQLWAQIYFDASKGATSVMTLQSFIERSKTVPLKAVYRCIELRGLPNLQEVTERIVTACDIMRKESHRLRALTFVGSIHHLFPISTPLPMLHVLRVKATEPGASLSTSVIPYLVSMAPRLEVFSYVSTASEPRVINPLGEIDLAGLRDVVLESGLDDAATTSSLSLCDGIRKLRISTSNITPLTVKGRFPHLHELELTGRSWDLPTIVTEAPQLVHVVMRDFQEGGIWPLFDEWPAFPHLRTLMCSVTSWSDVIPILRTSPRIVALRVSGEQGLCVFLADLRISEFCPDLQLLDIVHNSERGFKALEGEDSLRNLALIFRLLFTRYPKLTIKLREARRFLSTARQLDMRGLETEVKRGLERPDRFEIHRWSAGTGAPFVFETPLSELFACHEVISELAWSS